MELQLEKNLLLVDASQAKISCDACWNGRRACDKATPCSRCCQLGVECTHNRTKLSGRFVNEISRASVALRSCSPALKSWTDVVESFPAKPLVRFFLRRYVIPLIILLPEPALAFKLLQMTTKNRASRTRLDSTKPCRL